MCVSFSTVGGETLTLDEAEPSWDLHEARSRICEKLDVPPPWIRIYKGEDELRGDATLGEIGAFDSLDLSVVVAPQRLLFTTSTDRTARLWDAETGDCLLELVDHRWEVYGCEFSPNGELLLTAGGDMLAKIWDVNSGKCLHTMDTVDPCRSAKFSPDGKLILTAAHYGAAAIWSADSGEQLHLMEEHRKFLCSAVFSPDGKLALTASEDATAKIWDVSTGKCIRTLEGHSEALVNASFSPDQTMVLTASADMTARLWATDSGKVLHSLCGHEGPLSTAAWSPDGSMVVTGSADTTARIWNPVSGECIRVCYCEARVYVAVFSPDSQSLLTTADCVADVWDVKTGEWVHTLEGHWDNVFVAGFSPDGLLIVTAGGYGDCTAKVWSPTTGECLQTFEGHDDLVSSACFSPMPASYFS